MAEIIHQGRNIKRFREMLGLKQEGLAYELGDDWNQKKVSLLESKEVVDEVLLEQVAKVLKVPKAAITNLTDDGAINIIAETFNSNDYSFGSKCTFNINPIDMWVDAIERNEKLYERLVQVEREKNELLLQLLAEKGK